MDWKGIIIGWIAAALMAGLYLVLTEAPQPPAWMRPDAAVQYAIDHGLTQGNVINSYNYGGYLISRHIPTFIDGRGVVFGDLFGQFFFPNAERWEALCDKYHVTWALVEPKSAPAAYMMQSSRWKQAYADDTATVFERIAP